MARRIINKYIYILEDSGVEVLYSNMDSLFIKKSAFEKFNELFPNLIKIGDKLGEFHFDYNENNNYEYATEGIGRGMEIIGMVACLKWSGFKWRIKMIREVEIPT